MSEKRIDPVIKGGATKGTGQERTGNLSHDMAPVGRYLWRTILLPAFKRTAESMISNGAHMMIYREEPHGGNRSAGEQVVPRVSYRAAYEDRDPYYPRDTGTYKGYEYGSVVLDDIGDANVVVDTIADALSRYGVLSVGELYDMCKISGTHTDYNYGWFSIPRNLRPIRTSDDRYLISMPRPMPINDRRS